MTSTSPLAGYVVVELGHNVAGPVGVSAATRGRRVDWASP